MSNNDLANKFRSISEPIVPMLSGLSAHGAQCYVVHLKDENDYNIAHDFFTHEACKDVCGEMEEDAFDCSFTDLKMKIPCDAIVYCECYYVASLSFDRVLKDLASSMDTLYNTFIFHHNSVN